MKIKRYLGAPEVHFKLSQDNNNEKKYEKKNTDLSSTTSTQYLLHRLY
ncbi:MAG: hypothetical protein V2J07_06715 [Anaerolineae bacterium]|jgi:hypothetical protein|nr:hypothetical protein [Anaerolineae bacterium]